ncbi:MAG: hypothetical protein ACRD5H_14245, partial [Nitrososphaerales archaeon]
MPQAKGHAEGISLSASTSTPPTIDGIIETAEWSDASSLDIVLQGGDAARERDVGYIDATIYVMNDHRNLYIALKTTDTSLTGRGVTISFDDNHNGLREPGEDVLSIWEGIYGSDWSVLSPVKEDEYGAAPDHPDDGGIQDGSAAMTSDGVFNFFEFSHPLCSLDIKHDFCLSEGDTVGFFLRYIRPPWSYDFPADGGIGNAINMPSKWGDIIIAHSSVEDVRIDIQPRSSGNTVDCNKQKGKTAVGIFTEDGFDVQTMDMSS